MHLTITVQSSGALTLFEHPVYGSVFRSVTVEVSETFQCRCARDGSCWALVHLAITFQLHVCMRLRIVDEILTRLITGYELRI